MANNLKNCAYCRLDIPANASVCGYCGAKFRLTSLQRATSTRVLLAAIEMVKQAFCFGLLAVIAAYFFGETGTVFSWGIWSVSVGGVLGFIVGFSESKISSIEIAERE